MYVLQYGRHEDVWIHRDQPRIELPNWPPGPATPQMVEKVKEMLSYFDLVGEMSQIGGIIDGIHTILGTTFPNREFPPQPSLHTHIPKHFNVTDSDMAYICEVNKMDLELHRSLFPGAPRTCDEIMKRMHS
jgi:hypothetical protein